MALQEVTNSFLRRMKPTAKPLSRTLNIPYRRYASSESASQHSKPVQDEAELESTTFAEQGGPLEHPFDPIRRARWRNRELPPSRYSFRPPRYYRGPLHPHQPPPPSDPVSRAFVPGPFALTRLEQTYHDTIAPDLMTMMYTHFPPGHEPQEKGERLRPWIGDSPYFKNRPRRGPRGAETLRLLRKPITFRNIPHFERVTVHTMVKGALTSSSHLHIAGMVLQAITGVRATPHATKKNVAGFKLRQGAYTSVTCELKGEGMHHFLSKLVDVVMPKIKDWRGVKGTTGDNSGNLAFGLTGEEVSMFPEVEVNYDMYPAKMIPGCHIFIHTSARNDRDARMLLRSIGVPFYGKMVN